jgi:LacI family transcriptional regulator
MAKGSTSEARRIGLLLHPVRTYCRRVLRGITAVGARARWQWLLVTADAHPPLDTLSGGFLHGVIGHFADEALVEQVVRANLPAVDISAVWGEPALPRVTTDDIAVGRLAAAHLLSLGLPHFAFFGTKPHYYSMLRERGFRQAIEAAGLACHVFLDGGNGNGNGGADLSAASVAAAADAAAIADARGLEEWLRGLPKPIGLMASTDSRALQILAVCQKLGIPVPHSVAVLGVDNDDVFCEMANPSLSSVALATQGIGYAAARMLEQLIEGTAATARPQVLIPPAGVVPRRSSDLPAVIDPDVAAAVRYIALHVKDDLQVADVLREVHLSRTSLDQKFLKVLGRTPAAEIRRAQVEVAKSILGHTDESMPSVARAAGFSNAKQFGGTFLRETGMTPTNYRRAAHASDAAPEADPGHARRG